MAVTTAISGDRNRWKRVFVNWRNDGKDGSYEFSCLIYVPPGEKQKGEPGSVEERLREMTGGKIVCKPLDGSEWQDRTPPLP